MLDAEPTMKDDRDLCISVFVIRTVNKSRVILVHIS